MPRYNAYVKKVYDGDTITVDIFLGLGVVLQNKKIRLYGIDTPEVRGIERPEGLIAKEYLCDMILHKNIILETLEGDKVGKYGRLLGIIHIKDEESGMEINCNENLVANGFAEHVNY